MSKNRFNFVMDFLVFMMLIFSILGVIHLVGIVGFSLVG